MDWLLWYHRKGDFKDLDYEPLRMVRKSFAVQPHPTGFRPVPHSGHNRHKRALRLMNYNSWGDLFWDFFSFLGPATRNKFFHFAEYFSGGRTQVENQPP